jgi:integrase
MKRASLKYQLISAVKGVFHEKIPRGYLKKKILSKTATKEEVLAYECCITSFKYLDNIVKFVKGFVSWLKEMDYYADFQYAYQLNPDIFAEYLLYLAHKGVSRQTIKTYKTYIRKLEKILSYYYKRSYFDFTSNLDEILKTVDWESLPKKKIFHTLPVEDYIQFVDYLSNLDWDEMSNAQKALLIQAVFGLRSVEAVRLHWWDVLSWNEVQKVSKIEFSKMFQKYQNPKLVRPFFFLKSPYDAYIKVRGKAGQIRFVPCLFPAQYQLWRFMKTYIDEKGIPLHEKICPCNTAEMRREMKRILIYELGLKKYSQVPSSTHMLRKRVAKFVYQADTQKRFERVIISPSGDVKIFTPEM